MREPVAQRRIVRFAAFEFDPVTGELRKHGLRVKLSGQPVNLLTVLLERAGEAVTREELQKRLWPTDTFVDFEHSLNAAVKRLRAALGDSADAPRFVETLPRLGYRFIAPLSETAMNGAAAQPAGIRTGGEISRAAESGGWRRWVLLAVGAAVAAAAVGLTIERTEYFWRNPIADAQIRTVTEFDGVEQAAAVSRDGHFVAFLSDRDGQMDVWLTQLGSGQFRNLTRGSAPELVNPSVRSLGFSPDGSLVTFWVRRPAGADGEISVWAAPVLGGQPRPYLEGVAEFDWSQDGARLAYHTPGPGDPLFVSDGVQRRGEHPISTAPAGDHSHFPVWSPDGEFIYFIEGSLPDKLDIWRIRPTGGMPERITSHQGRVTHPVFLDRRTLLYLATDPDGSGPWLYSLDVQHRTPHRLVSGPDRYTSLAISADGRHLVVTRARETHTLWRLQTGQASAAALAPSRMSLPANTGFSPRFGPNYLLYVSAAGASHTIWKVVNGEATELWRAANAKVIGGPAIARDGQQIALSVQQHGQKLLYVMQADGTNARVVADALDLQGGPAWASDGQSITSAVEVRGAPRLFRVPVDGRSPSLFVDEYSADPVWAPGGRFAVYSGADIGTTFSVKAVTAEAAAHPLPPLLLTRGARHMTFLAEGEALVYLRGEIRHKDVWLMDLRTGVERRLTRVPPEFEIRDFDISPDGREVVLERAQERSDVVTLDLARP